MLVKIEFSTDNAAFEDNFVGAMNYVMEQVARKARNQIARSEDCLCTAAEADDKLLDSNGNTVGSIVVVK